MNEFLFYQTVNMATRLLPRRVCYAAARHAAHWAYRHNQAVRNALSANLRMVLNGSDNPWTEAELDQIVRRNFVNFGKYVVDFFQTGRLSPQVLESMIKVEHIEYLHQCLAMNRGVIGLTAHIGNWELGAAMLGQNENRVNAIVLEQSSARLDRLFQSQRIRRGINPLQMDNAASSVMNGLRRNELVVLLADLDFTGSGHRVPLFGQPARIPRGAAVLARRSGAPILPAFVLRQPDDTFCFRACPPILPDRSQTVEDIQQCICAVLEEVIGNHPDQWFAYTPLW